LQTTHTLDPILFLKYIHTYVLNNDELKSISQYSGHCAASAAADSLGKPIQNGNSHITDTNLFFPSVIALDLLRKRFRVVTTSLADHQVAAFAILSKPHI